MIVNLPNNVRALMDDSGKIIGRVHFKFIKEKVEILQLDLIRELLDSLLTMGSVLVITISEYDEVSLAFLRKYGFRGVGISRDWARKGVCGYILEYNNDNLS